jgi:hypothetical protein
MVNFKALEEDAISRVREVIAEAESHEPAIEDALVAALGEAGAPAAVATALGGLASALVAHFTAQKAVAQVAPTASAGVDVSVPPAQPVAAQAAAAEPQGWAAAAGPVVS